MNLLREPDASGFGPLLPLLTDVVQDAMAPTRVYPGGVVLYSEGQRLDEVVHVSSGVVKLCCNTDDGDESILRLALGGSWLGTAAVIADCPSPMTAITCGAATLSGISATSFRRMIECNPELSRAVHRLHAMELCRGVASVTDLRSLSSRRRLERILQQFVDHEPAGSGRAVRLQLPLHRWELASLIGVTPEHLSRVLRQMENENIVRCVRGWIVVTEPDRLAKR